jgi:hypothetical protein
MKQNTKKEKWYDNNLIVILLIIIFFPVGLYALWKNSNFNKILKIGITAIFLVLVYTFGETEQEKSEKVKSKIETSKKVNEVQKNEIILKKTKQELFISKKLDLLREYLNTTNNAKKSVFLNQTKKITNEFLQEENNILKNWYGEISMIQLGNKKSDINLLKKGLTPNQVKEKDPYDRPIDVVIEVKNTTLNSHSLYISVNQTQNKKFIGGVKKSNPFYKKLFDFEKGQKINFTAKVTDFKEFNTKIENSIIFNVELIKIDAIK